MTFVLLEVGCLECHEYTDVVGIYIDRLAAEVLFEERAKKVGYRGDDPEYMTFTQGTAIRSTGFGRLQLHEIGET